MVLGIPYTGQIEQFLVQYFSDLTGFYGLLALVPLVIFYLTRPKPKEMTMPSMMFFKKNKKTGKIQQAIRYLHSNLIMILHILFIILLASALAKPFLPTGNTSDHVVSIIDVSASMEDDMGEAKEFLKSRLGEENTIIRVGDDLKVPMEKASASQTRSYLDSVEAEDTETDIATALETASNYQGDIHVASDLDQTVSDKNVIDTLNSLQNQRRKVSVMDARDDNRWGIVDLSIGQENATAEVKNFMDQEENIDVNTAEYAETVTVGSGEVASVTFPVEPGKNTFELKSDPVTSDNKAHISIPEDENFQVAFISDSSNFHFEKAVELIDFTDIQRYDPPIQEQIEADIYVVGKVNELLSTTMNEIKEKAKKEGDSLVVFRQPGIIERFEDLPVKEKSEEFNGSIEITEPQRIWVNNVKMPKIKKTQGEALATENAVVKSEYGSGNAVVYSLADTEFKYDFLYPVFWKHLFQDLTDRPTVQELNLETGERIEGTVTTPDGEKEENLRTKYSGFYESMERTYGVNLLSEDESNPDNIEFSSEKTIESGGGEQPIQHYVVLALLALALLEFIYLIYGGVL